MKDCITAINEDGLCNRLKALLSVMRMADLDGRQPCLIWPREGSGGRRFPEFHRLFTAPDVEVVSEPKGQVYCDWRLWVAEGDLPPDWSPRYPAWEAAAAIDFQFDAVPAEVQREYLRCLARLEPHPDIAAKAAKALPGNAPVAVHIRSAADWGPERAVPLEAFFAVMDGYPAESIFYVACADCAAEAAVMARYPGRVIFQPDRVWEADHEQSIYDALVDLLCLAKGRELIASYASTFSEMAWWFGGCRQKVVVVAPAQAAAAKAPPEPARMMPEYLRAAYTADGRIAVVDWYFNQSVPTGAELCYRRQQIDDLIAKAKRREENYYGATDSYLYAALEAFPVKGKTVAIIGSVTPWYESVALAFGAAEVVSIDYNRVVSEDARIQTLSVDEFRKQPRTFDVAFSISSIEHDGLGRYGDALDPQGDLKAMTWSKSLLNSSGLLYLAVPVGQDKVVWNAHRIYGRLRLPRLLAGWEPLASLGLKDADFESDCGANHAAQPVFVLRARGC